jgi:hypothetical protein
VDVGSHLASRGLGHFACWLGPFRIHNTQKTQRKLAKCLVRQCSAQNTPGANQFSRATSVVFSEFEFVVSTQSDAEPGRERTLVLAMEMVGKPGERRFYAELLAFGAPQSPRADIVQWSSRCCAF